jgi:hypothetical protein
LPPHLNLATPRVIVASSRLAAVLGVLAALLLGALRTVLLLLAPLLHTQCALLRSCYHA